VIDWFDSKTDELEKAWCKYIDLKHAYQKQVGICPIQPFPAGFDAGWEAAKRAYAIHEVKEKTNEVEKV